MAVGEQPRGGSTRGSTFSIIDDPATSFLFDVPETADLLRTTPDGIYSMVARDQLPGVTRIGRRLLFRRDILLDWLRHKSATPSREVQR